MRIQIVEVPRRSWRWGHRAELRVRRDDDPRPLKGRGCHEGLVACHTVDARYSGPRSHLGQLLDYYRGQ